MKCYLQILFFSLLVNLAQANNPFGEIDIDSLHPSQVEEIVMLSYSIKDEAQLTSVLDLVNGYLITNPRNSKLQGLYQQRVQHYTSEQELTDCVTPEAQGFAERVLDDAITVAPCAECEGLLPLQNSFSDFAKQFINHQQEESEDLIQAKFLELGIISAAENLAQVEYLSNPQATAQSIYEKICLEQNPSAIVNFFTSQKHISECSQEMAPAIRQAIERKVQSLTGQERFSLPQDSDNILGQLRAIVDELNATLEPVTATVRPVIDLSGRAVSHTMKTFGPQMALQLDPGSSEQYQNFLQLFYQRTSQGVGSLLLSSKIMGHLPSIEINNSAITYSSDFIQSGKINPWGDEIHVLPKLPYPDDVASLKNDIEATILDGAQELKNLEVKDLSPRQIGKYVALNPLNLAKVLTHYPELTDEACHYINYAQEFTSRREDINQKLRTASRWLGVGGAALSLIAGPLGAVPACIIGASAGTLATATSGAVLLRELNHLENLRTAQVTGGADRYTTQEIIDTYDSINRQTLETLLELGFTIFDYVQLARAMNLPRMMRLSEGVDQIVQVAKKHGIRSKKNLIEFTQYIKKVEGANFTHFTDLSDDIADAFQDIHKVADDIRVRRINEAQTFHENWRHVELDQAIEKFAGEHPVISTTDSGKILYTNPDTGVRVVHDYYGDYIRIENPSITGKRRYLDLDGGIPNNSVTPEGRTIGNNNSAYNGLTHFSL